MCGLLICFCIQLFPTFFIVKVFQGSNFFTVQVFLGPSFSGAGSRVTQRLPTMDPSLIYLWSSWKGIDWSWKNIREYHMQKQLPEVFYVKRCSWKFRKIHRKTPKPDSLFQWSCRPLQLYYKKKTLTQGFSCEFCEIFKNTFFKEHFWTLLPHMENLLLLWNPVWNWKLFLIIPLNFNSFKPQIISKKVEILVLYYNKVCIVFLDLVYKIHTINCCYCYRFWDAQKW